MDGTAALVRQLETPVKNTRFTPLIYKVKPGDTISKVILKHYDIHYNDPRYNTAQASILYFNDFIQDPNEIYASQLLRLMPLGEDDAAAFCPVPDDFYKQ